MQIGRRAFLGTAAASALGAASPIPTEAGILPKKTSFDIVHSLDEVLHLDEMLRKRGIVSDLGLTFAQAGKNPVDVAYTTFETAKDGQNYSVSVPVVRTILTELPRGLSKPESPCGFENDDTSIKSIKHGIDAYVTDRNIASLGITVKNPKKPNRFYLISDQTLGNDDPRTKIYSYALQGYDTVQIDATTSPKLRKDVVQLHQQGVDILVHALERAADTMRAQLERVAPQEYCRRPKKILGIF